MIKKHLNILIITSVVILLPILAGVMLWDQLPEQIPIHWNMAGEIDDWSSKSFAVFGLPLILLSIQWLTVFVISSDPKNKNYSTKVRNMIFWLVPVLDIALSAAMYSVALGGKVRVEAFLCVFLGLLFIVIGNYLPKCQQSYTIGIKLPWTLHSEENWNRTHRMAGRIWVIGGFLILFIGFFKILWLMLPVVLIMTLIPIIYSYILHRKGI